MDRSSVSRFSRKPLPFCAHGEVMIRFVGGPFHNKLVTCKPTLQKIVPYVDIESRQRRGEAISKASYFLYFFETEYETPYAQYVYSQLINMDGSLKEPCDCETFAPFVGKRALSFE